MAFIRQVILSLALLFGAVVLLALYVPSAAPMLQEYGVYERLGLKPPEQAAVGGAPGGGRPRTAAAVLAVPVAMARLTDEVSAIGDGRARHLVVVRSDVSGRVVEMRIASGQKVAAGDVLMLLDDAAERIALEKARLMLADAQEEMARVTTLSETGAATAVRRRSAELAEQAALLGVKQAEFDLSQKVILAPISGWVGLLEVEVGDRITSQEELATLTDRSHILVDFRVPERLTGRVQPDVTFEAEPLALRGRLLTGRVVAVDNVIDRASRTLRVQGELPNPDDALRAGMAFAVTMRFEGQEYPSVPALAVQWSSDGAFVWAVKDDKAQRIPVSILRRNAENVLVDGALQPGDMIVVEGVQNLRPGAGVEVRTGQSALVTPGETRKARL